MNEITCTGLFTYEEILEAQEAIWRTHKKAYKLLYILIALCAFLLLIMTLLNHFAPSFVTNLNGGNPPAPLPISTSGIIGILIFVVLYFVVLK